MNSAYTWSSDGRDLRVFDSNDASTLNFFIESWDAGSQTAVIWVQLDNLSANSTSTIFLYYGNTNVSTASSALTFTDPGIKFNTRFTTGNPNNRSTAFNLFNNAPLNTPGYGCTFITNFTNINNRNQFSPPSRNGNFAAYSESFFEVLPGEAGVWEFRYGADFGRGGGLYVDDIALEEQWNDDLWWAFNFNASNEVLQGSINLSPGFHKLEILGFEGCCDGGITVQYRRPGGNFQNLQTATINIVSRKCPVTEPTLSYVISANLLPNIIVTQTSTVFSDPINLTTNPKAIPGARIRQLVNVTNTGPGTPDMGSTTITNPIPINTSLYVAGSPFLFSDGTDPSGITINFSGISNTSDDIEFSDDNGASFNYTPTPGANGADPTVTHIRATPSGNMNCSNGSSSPNFNFSFDVVVD